MGRSSPHLEERSRAARAGAKAVRGLVSKHEPLYKTARGAAYLADALDLLRSMPERSVSLVLTSPPYALHFKKEYGNADKESYVDWFRPFAAEIKRVLKPDGIFVLNIGGSYNAGHPTRSLYQFRLLLMLCDEIGFGTNATHLRKLVRTCRRNPSAIFGTKQKNLTEELLQRTTRTMGQLLLGRLAERAFLDIYRLAVRTPALLIADERSRSTDTDFRLLDEEKRPVARLNIKLHGAVFRDASDLVGLDPEDCFPLATYKIHSGLQKQQGEHVPFVFVVVVVPGLNADVAGACVPADFVALAASTQQDVRAVEDAIVSSIIERGAEMSIGAKIEGLYKRIRAADWHVISARKAESLLRQNLFGRVYALRVRGFTSRYRNAEVDMHLSMRDEMTSLYVFLKTLHDAGVQGLASQLERGTI